MDTDVWHLGCLDQHLCPVTSWEEEPHVRVGSVIYVLICICRLMAGTCDSNPLSKSKCRTWDWAQCVLSQPSLALQKGAQGWDLRPPHWRRGLCIFMWKETLSRPSAISLVTFVSHILYFQGQIPCYLHSVTPPCSQHLRLSNCFELKPALGWNCFELRMCYRNSCSVSQWLYLYIFCGGYI